MSIPAIQRRGRAPVLALKLDEPAPDAADVEQGRNAALRAAELARATLATYDDLLDISRVLVYYAVVSAPAGVAAVAAGGDRALDDALAAAAPLRLNYDAYCNARDMIASAGHSHSRLAGLLTAATFLKVRGGAASAAPSDSRLTRR